MKTYHSNVYHNENIIKPGDIFISNHLSPDNKTIKKHFFVCIYSQFKDNRTSLFNDIVGILITSNQKYDEIYDEYAVKVNVKRKSYACVDKQFRFTKNQVSFVDRVSEREMTKIILKMEKFTRETERQMYEAKRVLGKKQIR